MSKHTIKYYPVGNGDNTLITLSDGTTIMVDCNIRETSKGDTDPTMYDVKADLLKSLKKRNGNFFVDVFILTHGDLDHCRGFKNNFYQGDPSKYGEKNKKADEIIIDELWFSPMIAEEHTNDDEDVFQEEAERRLELHKKKDSNRDLAGNRIKIIGYDGKKDFSELDHLRKIPGDIINEFNAKKQNTVSFFVHAPFKEQLKSAEKDKNTTSIVFQARFKNLSNDTKYSCLAMFGGDSDHYSWEVILEKTKKKKNHETEQALDWDLFLAPHHCSWSFFNDRPQDENPDPKDHSKEVLGFKRKNAKVIASCNEILKPKPNPPHYAAKEVYEKEVGKGTVLNTETYKKKGKTPQPIIFEISSQGPIASKEEEGSAKNTGGSSLGVVNSVSSYGSKNI